MADEVADEVAVLGATDVERVNAVSRVLASREVPAQDQVWSLSQHPWLADSVCGDADATEARDPSLARLGWLA
ncbi:MAG: hypothetical protein ACK4MD_11155 [Demequina sp.]